MSKYISLCVIILYCIFRNNVAAIPLHTADLTDDEADNSVQIVDGKVQRRLVLGDVSDHMTLHNEKLGDGVEHSRRISLRRITKRNVPKNKRNPEVTNKRKVTTHYYIPEWLLRAARDEMERGGWGGAYGK